MTNSVINQVINVEFKMKKCLTINILFLMTTKFIYVNIKYQSNPKNKKVDIIHIRSFASL